MVRKWINYMNLCGNIKIKKFYKIVKNNKDNKVTNYKYNSSRYNNNIMIRFISK